MYGRREIPLHTTVHSVRARLWPFINMTCGYVSLGLSQMKLEMFI